MVPLSRWCVPHPTNYKLTHLASSRIHSIRLRGAHPSRRAGAAAAVGDLRHSWRTPAQPLLLVTAEVYRMKIPFGPLNWLRPEPYAPKVVHPVPAMSSMRTIRWLSVSAT